LYISFCLLPSEPGTLSVYIVCLLGLDSLSEADLPEGHSWNRKVDLPRGGSGSSISFDSLLRGWTVSPDADLPLPGVGLVEKLTVGSVEDCGRSLPASTDPKRLYPLVCTWLAGHSFIDIDKLHSSRSERTTT